MELKRNLQAKGSDLCIRYGQPEKLVIDLVKSLQEQQGQDKVDIEVFMAGEVTEEEIRVEHNIQTQCKTNIIRGSHTLVHPDDVRE